jgi:two-component system, sensor histidine kinase and response regulator
MFNYTRGKQMNINNHSILVVDDEPDNFEVIEALLTSMPYTLHYANHGQKAIDSLDKFQPDLILLDVMMPDIDGIEVCKKIKSIHQWQAVPVIMVTALNGTNDLANCLSAGADDFISKPVNGIELRARVQSMLRIKKQHDRIQSLSKLQRNSINSLTVSLNELNHDISNSFSNEDSACLHNILSQVNLLQSNLGKMTESDISEVLHSVSESASELEKFNQKFLFSRQLSPTAKEGSNKVTCTSKISIEQIAIKQINLLQQSPKLIFDIEDVELAITPKHLQYLLAEIMDYILEISDSQGSINLHGHVMNEEFHFYIDNRNIDLRKIPNSQISSSVQFDSTANSEQNLNTRLKIAKKISEIYDGVFLTCNTNLAATTIYLTLPLRRSVNSRKPLVNALSLAADCEGSISDELNMNPSQFSLYH